MDMSELEQQIRNATGAHGKWKLKLSQAVATGELPMPAADIACDNKCEFGRWLHGLDTDSVSGHAAYKNVIDAHANFHRVAGDVAFKVENGERDAARSLLDSEEYRASTVALTTEMSRWRAAIR